jgi:hypothetical protein
MATVSIKLSEYHTLSTEDRTARVQDLLNASKQPLHEELTQLDEEVAVFERRYEMSSNSMQRRLASHQINHTGDICRWLILLDLRQRVIPKLP